MLHTDLQKVRASDAVSDVTSCHIWALVIYHIPNSINVSQDSIESVVGVGEGGGARERGHLVPTDAGWVRE